jgi:hypothetical protein
MSNAEFGAIIAIAVLHVGLTAWHGYLYGIPVVPPAVLALIYFLLLRFRRWARIIYYVYIFLIILGTPVTLIQNATLTAQQRLVGQLSLWCAIISILIIQRQWLKHVYLHKQ